MAEQVLFVDDEPAILDGYRRLLYKDFLVTTAVGGEQGLRTIEDKGPFAVVVSDMRMPQMDGVQFLLRVKEISPDTIRLILTGQTELQAAVDAVNLGSVFRFLTKPCSRDVMVTALQASLRQYHLLRVERDLLEQTLSGSVQVMTEILSLISPASFGRAMRLRRAVRNTADKIGLADSWQLEVATMLSQLGCITLHPELIEAAYAGRTLDPADQERFNKHPLAAWELLSHIPRMQSVAWIIAQQIGPVPELETKSGATSPEEETKLRTAALVLRLALGYDGLVSRGASHDHALAMLAARAAKQQEEPAPELRRILEVMGDWTGGYESGGTARSCAIRALSCGMILEEDVVTRQGVLIVTKGQEITQPLMLKLKTFWQHGAIEESVLVNFGSDGPPCLTGKREDVPRARVRVG